MPTPFPTEFPSSEVKQVIAAAAGGSVAVAVHPAWVVAGYGLGMIFPDGPAPAPTFRAILEDQTIPVLSDEELADTLEELSKPSFAAAPGDPKAAFPWLSVVKTILTLVIGLMDKG